MSWISVTIDGAGARAELHGITHRLPRVRRIPMSTASALAADGVPLVVRRAPSRDAAAAGAHAGA